MPGPRAPTSSNPEPCPLVGRARLALGRRLVVVVGFALGLGLLAPRPLVAEARMVVLLLRPVPTSETVAEAVLRIKSELSADGFDVVIEDRDSVAAGTDMRAAMERSGQRLAPSATLGMAGDLEQGPAELWVVDRITGKTVVRRLEIEPSRDRRMSEVIAIRAEELLRASLLELLIESDRPVTVPAPPQAERWVQQAVAAPLRPWRLALEVGAATLAGEGGVGASVAAAARVRVALDHRLWLRLSAVGLGTRPTVISPGLGSARVSQNVLLVEGAASFFPGHRVRPMVSLGLGAERVGVDGEGDRDSPYLGRSTASWFAAADVGAGVTVRLQAHWELQLEAHALFTAARPAVRFFDVEAARAGQPTVMVTLTLAGGA